MITLPRPQVSDMTKRTGRPAGHRAAASMSSMPQLTGRLRSSIARFVRRYRVLEIVVMIAIPVFFVTGLATLLQKNRDSAASCFARVYRDPVTGRSQAIGPARLSPDGSIRCDGISYSARSSAGTP